MIAELLKKAAAKRASEQPVDKSMPHSPTPMMPAITINIVIGDRKKSKDKQEEDELAEAGDSAAEETDE